MRQHSIPSSAETQLDSFIEKFAPDHQRAIRKARGVLRARFPAAYELVYDNYNFLVIGYSPTTRPSDSVLSITANASGLGLCFIHGATLPDPAGILLGSGKQTRFVRLPSSAALHEPAVVALINAADAQARIPFGYGDGGVIIRSISAKQRPRRKH